MAVKEVFFRRGVIDALQRRIVIVGIEQNVAQKVHRFDTPFPERIGLISFCRNHFCDRARGRRRIIAVVNDGRLIAFQPFVQARNRFQHGRGNTAAHRIGIKERPVMAIEFYGIAKFDELLHRFGQSVVEGALYAVRPLRQTVFRGRIFGEKVRVLKQVVIVNNTAHTLRKRYAVYFLFIRKRLFEGFAVDDLFAHGLFLAARRVIPHFAQIQQNAHAHQHFKIRRIVEIYVRLLHARNDLIGYGVDAVGVFRYAIKLIISRKRFVVIVQHIRHPFCTESGGKKRNVDDFLIRVEYDAVVVSVPLASRKGKRSQCHAERKQPNQNFFHVFSPYALISNTLAEYFCFMVTMNFSPSIRKGTLMPEG